MLVICILLAACDEDVHLSAAPATCLLHRKPDILNLIEKNTENSLKHIDTGENYLNRPPKPQDLRSIIDKWSFMKLKSFCKSKDTVNMTQCQPSDWVNIFTNPTSDRELISKIY